MPKSGRFCALVGLLVLLGFGAISCSQPVSLNPVQGKVLHQSKPLGGALVVFHPEAGQDIKQQSTTGLTKEDGTFSLTTGETSGAPAGKYVVTIICATPVASTGEGMAFGGIPETEDRLKGAYANRDTSQIKVEIKTGSNQLEPFDLK